jgi:FkbM family methyltransferase
LAGAQGEDLAWSHLDSGPEILVPLNDFVGRAAFYVGDLDRKISGVIKRIVRPGDRVLDIGANIGVVTLHLAKLVGKTGMVHSFEPNPNIADLLLRSVERNRMDNVHVHRCALGAEEGVLTLSFPARNAGQATINKARAGEAWESVQVQVRTLSALAQEFEIGKVRLVKMDVEGFEPEVLRGARGWLSDHPPDAMIFESNEERAPGESDPVFSLLAEQDYVFYAIPMRLLSLRLQAYDPASNQALTSHDVLAVRRICEQEIISQFRTQT